MCGIAGIWARHRPKKEDLNIYLGRMSQLIKHRGPDNSGAWIDPAIGLGIAHQRLSILDLSEAGNQPMVSNKGRYVISFNGEIYNHKDIRCLIKNKISYYPWRGSSDTETLLAAIETFGLSETLNKCKGMFAFALWDKENRTLSLVRDRFGEKPLYFGELICNQNDSLGSQSFLFSSEISAFKSFSPLKPEINIEALDGFFAFGYIPNNMSIYKGINQIPPGHILTIQSSSIGCAPFEIPKTREWWGLINERKKFVKKETDSLSLINNIESKLRKSIEQRSIADVDLAVFLSGGIDSSLVTTLLSQSSRKKVNSFTISFPDDKNNFNEGPIASEIAKILNTNHTDVAMTKKDVQEIIPNLSSIYSEPFADSSQVPTHLISLAASKSGIKVALTGDGGDELFAGYNRHLTIPFIIKYTRFIPLKFRNKLSSVLLKMPFSYDSLSRNKIQKLSDALLSKSDIASVYESLVTKNQSLLISDLFNTKNNRFNKSFMISSLFNKLSNFEDLEKILIADAVFYLPWDILTKVDRASMAVSLETRAPFLDHELAQFAFSLNSKFKIRKHNFKKITKWPLRQILKKYVPEVLVNNPKSGFAMPIGNWLRGPLKDWASYMMNEGILNDQSFLDTKKVKILWEDHLNFKRDNTEILWRILMWQCWIQNY